MMSRFRQDRDGRTERMEMKMERITSLQKFNIYRVTCQAYVTYVHYVRSCTYFQQDMELRGKDAFVRTLCK